MRLDKVGVFTYSREEGTPAYDMPNQVPEEIMQERYHDLMSLQCKISEQINQSLEGKELDVLVEGRDEEQPNISVGRSYREARRSTARSTSRTTRTASRATSCVCASCRASPTTSSASASTMAMPAKQGRRQRNEQETS